MNTNLVENLKNLLFIFPVMLYYFFEALIAAFFVAFVWRFALQPTLGIEIGYFKWVAIIWIIKVVFFDVFKLISGLSTMNNNQKQENQE